MDVKENGIGNIVKTFLSMKYGKRILCAIVLSVILMGGFGIFKMMTNNKTVDVFGSCKVEYEGISGKGSAKLKDCDIKFDATDVDLYSFVSGIRYEIKNNGSLENGNMLNVTAVYDKAMADSLNVSLNEEVFQVKIDGLIENYETYAKIPSKMKKEIDTAVMDAFEKSIDDEHFSKIVKDLKRTGTSVIYKIYAKEKDLEDETSGYDVVYLCKASASGKKTIRATLYTDGYEETTQDVYYTIRVNHVNSKFTLKEFPVSVTKVRFFSDKTDQEIIDALIESYEDYTIEVIK